MKKSFVLLQSILLLILACTKPKPKNIADSTPLKTEKNNSLTKNENTSSLSKKKKLDETFEEKPPVKIIESKLLKNQYSDHKDIKIVFKNSGKKDIQAIKFEWICENSFREPANGRYFYGEGKFKGEISYLLKAGKTNSKIWEDFSTDANHIIKVQAYYIVFTDGTNWKLKI